MKDELNQIALGLAMQYHVTPSEREIMAEYHRRHRPERTITITL